MMEEQLNPQIESMASLLVLNDAIKKLANLAEFASYIANETYHLTPYHIACVWMHDTSDTKLLAISGNLQKQVKPPLENFMLEFAKRISMEHDAAAIHQVETDAPELPLAAIQSKPDHLRHALWCPFVTAKGEVTGGLILFRETPVSTADINMIKWLIASYQYTWNILYKKSQPPFLKQFHAKSYAKYGYIVLAIILLFPTRLTVYGTGSVIPKDPALIKSPMQAVIKNLLVSPGDLVTTGQLLVSLDSSEFNSLVDNTKRDYLLTQTRLRSAINTSLENKSGEDTIPVLRAQLDIDKANYDYASRLLQKTRITSPVSGIVILNNKNDLSGKPVKAGERILSIANPDKVQLRISFPVKHFMKIENGATGKIYLYSQLTPTPIKINSVGYNAEIQPDKTLGYTFYADFTSIDELPPIGAEGSVEIYNQHVPFFYYVLRRPLQSFRRIVGI